MSLDLDKSAWKRVAFGDVVRNVNETVRDVAGVGIDRVIAMEHMDPGELKIKRWASAADGTTFTRRVRPGQTLFGKRRAYQRKVAYAEFDAICSGDIYTFEATHTQILGEFLPFLVQSNEFFDHALNTSAGSLSPRTNWRDLANFEFNLPPLDEQQRIADLLWSIEGHKLALRDSVRRACELLARITTIRLAAMPTSTRLGDLATIRSGPSFAASDVHKSPVPGSVPVLGIPNTRPDGTIDLEGVGYVTGLPDAVGRINGGSLVLIRTNGNRQRIGNVYLPPIEAHGHAVSAFQFLVQVKDHGNREYLFWFLNEAGMQERMSDGASGTVGLGNLAVRWLNDQHVPWSRNPSERLVLVEELKVVSAAIGALEADVASTSALSRSMLAKIFGGS